MAPHCTTCPNMAQAQRAAAPVHVCACNYRPLPGAVPFQYTMVTYGHTLPGPLLQGFSSTHLIRPGVSQDPVQSRDLIIAHYLTSNTWESQPAAKGTLWGSLPLSQEKRTEGTQSRGWTAMNCLFLFFFLLFVF